MHHRFARRFIPAIAAVVALTGCSETGDPAVYDQIDAISDCAELQALFDEYEASERQADEAGDDGASGEFRSYADAVERRMSTVGCNAE